MISKSNFYPFIFFIIIYVLYSLVRILQEEKVELEGKFNEMSNATRAANAAANDANNTAEHAIEKAGNAQETAKAAKKKADDNAFKLEDLENKMNDANASDEAHQKKVYLRLKLLAIDFNAVRDNLQRLDVELHDSKNNYEKEKKAKMLNYENEMTKFKNDYERSIANIEKKKDLVKLNIDMIDATWKQVHRDSVVEDDVPETVTSLRVETCSIHKF